MRLTALVWMAGSPLTGRGDPPQGWPMIFQDEFKGVALDATKWSTTMEFIGTHGPRYHNEFYLSYTCDEEVVVADGKLRLRTDRRTVHGQEKPGQFEYTQGLVSSHGKFVFTHGYVEVRAKYPGGKGLWPCIWLMPQHQGWPPEFDIAEYYAGQRTMHHGLAYGGLYDSHWDSTWDKQTDFESGWHTFALEWMPGRAVWSVDSVPCKTITSDYVPNTPMYLILSNSVSSRFGPSGEPDEKTVFPNAFEIEYVRVYQAPPSVTVQAVLASGELPLKDGPLPSPTPLPTAPAAPVRLAEEAPAS